MRTFLCVYSPLIRWAPNGLRALLRRYCNLWPHIRTTQFMLMNSPAIKCLRSEMARAQDQKISRSASNLAFIVLVIFWALECMRLLSITHTHREHLNSNRNRGLWARFGRMTDQLLGASRLDVDFKFSTRYLYGPVRPTQSPQLRVFVLCFPANARCGRGGGARWARWRNFHLTDRKQ